MRRLALCILIAALGLWAGCASAPRELGPGASSDVTTYYYDDILIPNQLKIDKSKTFIYDMDGFRAGTLYFSGRLEVNSLVDYFKDSMIKTGWRLSSIFRYPKMLLLFGKPDKSCLIIIEDGAFSTKVEIWVSPIK